MKKRFVGGLAAVVVLGSVAGAHAANWGTIKGYVESVALVETFGTASEPTLQITFDRNGTFCEGGSNRTTNVINITKEHSPVLFDSWVRAAQSSYLSGKGLKVRTQGGCRPASVTQCKGDPSGC